MSPIAVKLRCSAAADVADQRRAGVDADAEARPARTPPPRPRGRLLQAERRPRRASGMVRLVARRVEDDHHRVAREALDHHRPRPRRRARPRPSTRSASPRLRAGSSRSEKAVKPWRSAKRTLTSRFSPPSCAALGIGLERVRQLRREVGLKRSSRRRISPAACSRSAASSSLSRLRPRIAARAVSGASPVRARRRARSGACIAPIDEVGGVRR